jgi:CSLREA domain-containing protein
MHDPWISFSSIVRGMRLRPWLGPVATVLFLAAPTAATAASFVVNSPLDAVDAARGDGVCATASGVCTLRAAIQEANELSGTHFIALLAGTYTLTLAGRDELAAATGDLNIGSGRDIFILGAGLASTIIDANAIDRVFQSTGGRLTVNDVTVRNGNPGTSFGGCIYMGSGSTLTMNRSVVTGCTTGSSGGGGIIMFGASPSTLMLMDTTISQNTTTGSGGGVDLGGNVAATIIRSTISGNTASSGAGLDFFSPGGPSSTLNVANSTISGNTATAGGGGGLFMTASAGSTITLTNVTLASNASGGGGAIVNSGTGQLQIRNSIIANNTAASSRNCAGLNGGVFTDLGSNVEFPGSTCGFVLVGDQQADPLLGALGSNGGPTQTHALGTGSPAIDLGDPVTCFGPLVSGVDQRGFTRPPSCDAGAVEFGAGPIMSLDRTSLYFGAVQNGTNYTIQSPSQTVRLNQSGTGTVTWTAASNQPWLTVTPTSGSGPAVFTIAVNLENTPILPGLRGNITLTLTGAGNALGPLPVTLNVVATETSPPFGSFDTPVGDATVLAGSVAVTGWTLDNIGVRRVELWRDLQPGETTAPGNSTPGDPRNGKIFIANATFVENARPDVEGLYPTTPASYRGGWGYLMLTWGLFGQGNGTYRLYAFGVDQESNTATIGTKTIVVSNNTATKPFGSIDTPAIGGDASGPNFGWGLTPKVNGAATCKIQTSGVQYSIDSGPMQPVVYGDVRTDIAGAFPGFSNTAAAGGHAIIDWTALTNGPHTIGWLITDDCNRADGVGSRFFNVTSGTNVVAASDFRLAAESSSSEEFRLKAEATGRGFGAVPLSNSVVSAFRRKPAEGEVSAFRRNAALVLTRGFNGSAEVLTPGESGTHTIEVKQNERIELRAPRGYDAAFQLAPGGQPRALPIGSTWDAAGGIFYWQPAPGFHGPFRLVFSNGTERINVRVVVTP